MLLTSCINIKTTQFVLSIGHFHFTLKCWNAKYTDIPISLRSTFCSALNVQHATLLHFVQPKSKEGGPDYCDITCFAALLDWSINWLKVLIVLFKVTLWLGKCVEWLQFTNHWHQAQIFPFALYWLAVFWTPVMFHSTINRWYLDRNTTTVQYQIRTVNRNIHRSAGKFA